MNTHTTRRTVLKSTGAMATLLSLGIVTAEQAQAAGRAGFDAKNLQEAIQALGGSVSANDQVQIISPDIAENGAVVPVGAISRIPNTTEIYLLVEKNPVPMAAAFMIPAGTEPDVQTRLKMGQSTDVVAIVKADGKLYSATKETKVTLGGCGG